ncbi:Crp/Fnr family transcriptional regulator [Chitinophaga pinensis]|uniref:Transcriptional regulator, Crp/Fnr family n=1 Tax=Chitinophaga pinensis (strain ATCC 43595 / DSM 2588 / LMG 13176 / NBRC 15968 / NCIMB 11800 / UQM 2034) TaxID=485918 RepID=A0A979G987_CHIPD|nr:Crp/Fnr family transcriptional regulator [Chitinophaga pinensis]ACU63055.1 putative transcriptional regulator, Crp/Fnr family [Chitinophaga pinensis DSM 2588]
MFETFEAYITAKGHFTREELQLMRSLAIVKRYRRRQLLLKEGEVCQYKMFITKGLLKTYCLKNDGTEHIMRFAPENTWTTDHESFSKQIPSKANIEALEPTEVLLWTQDSLDRIMKAVPAFRTYLDALISNTLNSTYERILMNISYTSEEKYQDFISTYPDIFRRVPLHMVASYLGVSRETLSRIRHAQLKQQKLEP